MSGGKPKLRSIVERSTWHVKEDKQIVMTRKMAVSFKTKQIFALWKTCCKKGSLIGEVWMFVI